MPYKQSGNKVMVNKGGHWIVRQTTKSPQAAKRAVNLLRAVQHDWEPTKKK